MHARYIKGMRSLNLSLGRQKTCWFPSRAWHRNYSTQPITILTPHQIQYFNRLWPKRKAYQRFPQPFVRKIMDDLAINTVHIAHRLSFIQDPWRNPSSLKRCNFYIENNRLCFDPKVKTWTNDPSLIHISLMGASALCPSLFDGNTRSFSCILINYNGFGTSEFANYHIDSYARSFVVNLGTGEGYTNAIFSVGPYVIPLETRQAGEALIFPQKDLVSAQDIGCHPSDIPVLYKQTTTHMQEIPNNSPTFKKAIGQIFNQKGSVYHRGSHQQGIIVNVSLELPGNGYQG